MKVIFQIVEGPSKGRQIPMQSGERVRFGSGDIADISIPGDTAMSAVHFEAQCGTDSCMVRDLSGLGGVLINGEPATEASITDGDEIAAGHSKFVAASKQLAKQNVTDGETGPDDEVAEARPTAEELCEIVPLKEPSRALFRAELDPETYVDLLAEHKLYADAIKILAYYMPKQEAVWWCVKGVESVSSRELDDRERSALEATTRWLSDPSEQNRRAAMSIAEDMNMDNAACYAAASAFYSEGSMAPEGLPDVPPAPTLTGQVVSATLAFVAADGDPAEAEKRYLKLLKIGRDVLDGTLSLPASEA